MTSVFGPHTTLGQVRAAYIALCRYWIVDYLRDAERVQGVPRGQTKQPASWVPAARLTRWPEHHLPALIVSGAGLFARPERVPATPEMATYIAPVLVTLSAVVPGRDWADVQRNAEVYGDALKQLMLQKAGLAQGITVDGWRYEDEGYDDLPQRSGRTFTSASVTFVVNVSNWASDAEGPPAPMPPGTEPGTYPEVQQTDLVLDRRPLT